MTANLNFPITEAYLPDMMKYICVLAQEYESKKITSWELMENNVRTFFTASRLAEIEAIAQGWHDMATDINGITLIHVVAAFVSLLLCPEYQKMSKMQQELMKWIVFFHDLAKRIRKNQRDALHGFKSAAMTVKILHKLGFEVSFTYDDFIDDWIELVNSARIKREKPPGYIQDNSKLPEIIAGIEKLFGHNTPAVLITRTVLLHLSISVVQDWPADAPLTPLEIKKYIDIELLPLLKTMMIVDNDAWALFDQATKEKYRRETVEAFETMRPD